MKFKWEFAPETFNKWNQGKFSLDEAKELHGRIILDVRSDFPKKNYPGGHSLTDYILSLVQTELNLEVGHSAVNKWIKKIRGNSKLNIDDTVDWEDFSRLSAYSLPDLLPRIHQSTAWFDRYTVDSDNDDRGDFITESYRYVKWANYLITNMGVATILDIDLWVITKVLEHREIIGNSNQDIKDWIKYAPWRDETQQRLYLEAVESGKALKLEPIIGSTPTSIGMSHVIDSVLREDFPPYKDVDNQNKLNARQILARFLFTPRLARKLNKLMGENHLNYYDLPSVNLSKYVKLMKEKSIYSACSSINALMCDQYQGVTGAASDSLTIAYGEPAYVEMPIAEEVKLNQVSLKSSLKSIKNPEIVAKYTNFL